MLRCLSDAEISKFVEDADTSEQHTAAQAHLQLCPQCLARVEMARHSLATSPDAGKPPTHVDVTSAMEVARGSSGFESHWTDNDLPIRSAGGSPSQANLSLDEFLSSLSQSGLLPDAELANVRQKSHDEPACGTVSGLVHWLIDEHKLTSYQAELLARGSKGGLLIGNYVILEKLGQGGMGTVFKARHRRMNRIVALKVLPQALSTIPEAISRFQREVEAAARLTHPNIAAAFDADEAGGVHFLVMEYVDGPNLASYVKQRGPLPLAAAVRLMVHAADGLATAHGQGIVHRDIKPGNMMVNKQGVLKVLDMGLAQMRDQDANLDLTSDVTATGRVMGTVDYMSPEQARDAKNVDLRADIYSLGCTLYFLATGKAPAPSGSAAEKLLWHQTQTAPPLSRDVPQSTPRLDAVLAQMMAKKPEDRFASMHEVATELEQCLADLPAADAAGLLDGLDALAEHGLPTIGSSRYGQATMGASGGDTIRTDFGRRSVAVVAPPKPRKSRTVVYACGAAAAIVLSLLCAAPFALRSGRDGSAPDRQSAGTPDDERLRVAAKADSRLPLPPPSPHEPYQKLLDWVFSNHGQITAVTGGGEQLHLTEHMAIPNQPLEILGIKLDGTGAGDADLAFLALAPGLRELSLADTRVTDRGVEQLLPLRRLMHLNLSKTDVTNSGLAALSRLSELTELNLERTRITNPGVARLLSLSKLERLYLSDTQLTDIGIDQLKALPALKLLTLHATSLSDVEHAALKRAIPALDIAWDGADVERGVALKLLDLGATLAIVDRTGQRLQGIKHVEGLPPGRVSIKEIDLTTAASFGDVDLKQVAVLPDVESIRLQGTKTTAIGLANLHGLTTLRRVDLGTLRLPPTAIESLRQSLPDCQVVAREPTDIEVARAVLAAGGRVSVSTERNQMLRDLKTIEQLPAGQYTLRAINLDELRGIDDAALAKVGELPLLESLFLTGTSISDTGLANLAACKSLQELSLGGTKVTVGGLGLLTPLPKLSRLYLAGMKLPDDGLRQIGELAGLTHLSLRGAALLDDDLAPLKRLAQLEWLDLSGTTLTDGALTHLSRLAKLREINVTSAGLSDAGREELATALGQACRIIGDPPDRQRLAARWLVDHAATISLENGKLKSSKELPRGACHVLAVDLADLGKLRREDVKTQLAGCPDIVSLNLSGTSLGEADLAFLSDMRSLRELRLSKLSLSDSVLQRLAGHAGLETLDLSNTFVTGQGLAQLSAAAGLKQLLLANTRVSDLHFAALAQFPQLEVLDVSAASGVSDLGLEAISKVPTLKVVRLRGGRITDIGLEKLALLTDLEELDVEGAKITDAGVAKLAALSKLRVIGLANTQVTDGVTATLAQMKQLRSINLGRTKIAAESIKQLQAELKGCNITAPALAQRDPNAGANFGNTAAPNSARGQFNQP